MQEFDLPTNEALKVLKKKDISNLFHANTVQTSYTFLENGHLLSRQYVEEKALYQTPQYTDGTDKKYGIYNDIFMDTIDIHKRAKRRNNYGPILFVFSLTVLENLSHVRFTKMNPSKWADSDSMESRYYHSIEEFQHGYYKGNFDTMMIIPNTNGKFSLLNGLEYVLFDNPKLVWSDDKTGLCLSAINILKDAAAKGGLVNKGIGIKTRDCSPDFCNCYSQYLNNKKIQEIFRFK